MARGENTAHHPNRKVGRNRWQVEKMDREYNDEATGRSAWGVTDTHTEGYGYDTFDSIEEAQRHAREMNSQHRMYPDND